MGEQACTLSNLKVYSLLVTFIISAVCSSGLGRCPKYPPLPDFEIAKLSGIWYEVERSFYLMEMSASCTRLNVTVSERSQLLVNVTTVSRWTNLTSSSCGIGIPSANGSSIFRYKLNNRLPYAISRMLPGAGMYNVLFTDYERFAIIWSCASIGLAYTDQIWVLGREREFPAELRAQIYSVLRDVHLDPDRLILSRNLDCPTADRLPLLPPRPLTAPYTTHNSTLRWPRELNMRQ